MSDIRFNIFDTPPIIHSSTAMAPLFNFLLLCLLSLAFPLPSESSAGPITVATNSTFDYVVVGCGLAGLVVTMRLTELADVSVLCIEAGPLSVASSRIQRCR